MKKRTPFFYLYLHYRICQNMRGEVSRKDVESFLFQWKIPKEVRPMIIQEMEAFDLLKKKNRFVIVLNKPKPNPKLRFMREKYNVSK